MAQNNLDMDIKEAGIEHRNSLTDNEFSPGMKYTPIKKDRSLRPTTNHTDDIILTNIKSARNVKLCVILNDT